MASILSVKPDAGNQGRTVDVLITGEGTSFDQTSVLSFSTPGITGSVLTIESGTDISASIAIDSDAAIGPCDVIVKTDQETAVGTGLFFILDGHTPSAFYQG